MRAVWRFILQQQRRSEMSAAIFFAETRTQMTRLTGIRRDCTSSQRCRPSHVLAATPLLAFCLLTISPPDVRAATAVACVGTETPACKESSVLASAFQWGVKTYSGGGLLRGVAKANARQLGVEFLARTEKAASALLYGSASAGFSDSNVRVGLPNPATVTLTFLVTMSGGFSGSDFGPPCDHCGGQSPWVGSGTASGTAEANAPEQSRRLDFDTAWNSNDGVTNELEPEGLIEITVGSGMPFLWSSSMTVSSKAANDPCLSGAGTCGIEGGAEADGDFRSTFHFHDFHLYDAATHEEIFDFTLTGSDGIDYLAIDRGCGDGALGEGEECDDGNVDPGDCCSPGCKLETGACDDYNACTGAGTCDGASCVGAERFSCPLPCGDADKSGVLSAIDALIALKTAVGTSICDDCRCNANKDESVTTTDALRILQAAVGVDVVLDCEACLPDF